MPSFLSFLNIPRRRASRILTQVRRKKFMMLPLVFAGRKFRILEYRRPWPRQFRPVHGRIEKSSGHRPICLPCLARASPKVRRQTTCSAFPDRGSKRRGQGQPPQGPCRSSWLPRRSSKTNGAAVRRLGCAGKFSRCRQVFSLSKARRPNPVEVVAARRRRPPEAPLRARARAPRRSRQIRRPRRASLRTPRSRVR